MVKVRGRQRNTAHPGAQAHKSSAACDQRGSRHAASKNQSFSRIVFPSAKERFNWVGRIILRQEGVGLSTLRTVADGFRFKKVLRRNEGLRSFFVTELH